jgi:hypothetical protein
VVSEGEEESEYGEMEETKEADRKVDRGADTQQTGQEEEEPWQEEEEEEEDMRQEEEEFDACFWQEEKEEKEEEERQLESKQNCSREIGKEQWRGEGQRQGEEQWREEGQKQGAEQWRGEGQKQVPLHLPTISCTSPARGRGQAPQASTEWSLTIGDYSSGGSNRADAVEGPTVWDAARVSRDYDAVESAQEEARKEREAALAKEQKEMDRAIALSTKDEVCDQARRASNACDQEKEEEE